LSGWLLDTNVVSELRKRERADANVRAWFEAIDGGSVWLSVLVLGEIRRGIEALRRRDEKSARALDRWVARLEREHGSRVLPVDLPIALEWGRLNAAFGLSPVDGLLAATARVHRLALVTRNTKHVARTGIECLNPFAARGRPPSTS
jgi:predicted nucleic acid-binding protein